MQFFFFRLFRNFNRLTLILTLHHCCPEIFVFTEKSAHMVHSVLATASVNCRLINGESCQQYSVQVVNGDQV